MTAEKKVPKPTVEQTNVLTEMAKTGEPICYYKGGYWSHPIEGSDGRDLDNGSMDRRMKWHTAKQTVDAMEKRGWLARAATGTYYPHDRFPGLEDRTLTEAGRAILALAVFTSR